MSQDVFSLENSVLVVPNTCLGILKESLDNAEFKEMFFDSGKIKMNGYEVPVNVVNMYGLPNSVLLLDKTSVVSIRRTVPRTDTSDAKYISESIFIKFTDLSKNEEEYKKACQNLSEKDTKELSKTSVLVQIYQEICIDIQVENYRAILYSADGDFNT